MTTKRMLIGGQLLAVDKETGELVVKVSGIQFDKDIDVGDVHILDCGDEKIDPATVQSVQDASQTVLAAMTGTGLPIPLPLADAGNNEWSAPLEPNPITRACTRLFYRVGSSGFEMSFDGGVTVHIARPEDTSADMAIAIPQGSDVRIRRMTTGTAIDGLIVEVR